MNSTPTKASASAEVATCPRCKKPLIDPSGLGWCKACGYCRSLEESPATPAPTSNSQPNTISATSDALAQTPSWVWVTFVGIGVVAGAAFLAGRHLPLPPFERALLTTMLMAGGAAMMFFGQFIGLMRVAPEDSTLSFKDAVVPFRLYGLVLKRMPGTRYTIYLGTWGLTLMIAAGILIGGLGHWFTYLPNSQKAAPNAAKAKK